MKFLSCFQPIYQLPQGFKKVGPQLTLRGEVPDGAEDLIMVIVRKEYLKKYPEQELALQTAQGLVGGVLSWDSSDEEMLDKAEQTEARAFIEKTLAEAIVAEPLPDMPMMPQMGMPPGMGRRRPGAEGIQVPTGGLREALLKGRR